MTQKHYRYTVIQHFHWLKMSQAALNNICLLGQEVSANQLKSIIFYFFAFYSVVNEVYSARSEREHGDTASDKKLFWRPAGFRGKLCV
jgi:uncharacterized protein YfiM (DUF2279 family)